MSSRKDCFAGVHLKMDHARRGLFSRLKIYKGMVFMELSMKRVGNIFERAFKNYKSLLRLCY